MYMATDFYFRHSEENRRSDVGIYHCVFITCAFWKNYLTLNMKRPCVYILGNKNKSVLYTGVTSDITQRIMQHRNHTFGGFSARYNLTELLFVEYHPTMELAIDREKQIKSWSRDKKIDLIASQNPAWRNIDE